MLRIRVTLLLLAFLAGAPALASGSFRHPAAGEKLTAGAPTEVRWSLEGLDLESEVEEMELLLSLDGGTTYPLRVTKELDRKARQLAWRVPNFPTRHARLALRTGSKKRGEVVRAESPEFEIVTLDSVPLERFRLHLAEWWTVDALEGRSAASTLPDGLGLSMPSETIGAPADGQSAEDPPSAALPTKPGESPETVEPVPLAPVAPVSSLCFPVNLPKRE